MKNWIPCSERVPEWGVPVIVAWKGSDRRNPCEGMVSPSNAGEWVDGNGESFQVQPTHWLPYPEPPE